jgi:hypothetical protein
MLTAVAARMRRSGPGWVGDYVMDGRDTVIGMPKQQGIDCRRPGDRAAETEGAAGGGWMYLRPRDARRRERGGCDPTARVQRVLASEDVIRRGLRWRNCGCFGAAEDGVVCVGALCQDNHNPGTRNLESVHPIVEKKGAASRAIEYFEDEDSRSVQVSELGSRTKGDGRRRRKRERAE